MADKLMHIPNVDTQNYFFCRLQLVVKTFGHLTQWTNQLQFNESPPKWEASRRLVASSLFSKFHICHISFWDGFMLFVCPCTFLIF